MEKDNYTALREIMVRDQIGARGVRNNKILEVFRKVPRHLFVDPGNRHRSYMDHPLPIGNEQTISQPYIVAFMVESLDLKKGDNVLEIGTGSGYQTAILAEIAGEVYTIERIGSLQEKAVKVLTGLGYNNIYFKTGDGTEGWPARAPFNSIIVSAAAGEIPGTLLDQLSLGGRMIIPAGEGWMQELLLISRETSGFKKQNLGACRFVPLIAGEGTPES